MRAQNSLNYCILFARLELNYRTFTSLTLTQKTKLGNVLVAPRIVQMTWLVISPHVTWILVYPRLGMHGEKRRREARKLFSPVSPSQRITLLKSHKRFLRVCASASLFLSRLVKAPTTLPLRERIGYCM